MWVVVVVVVVVPHLALLYSPKHPLGGSGRKTGHTLDAVEENTEKVHVTVHTRYKRVHRMKPRKGSVYIRLAKIATKNQTSTAPYSSVV